MWVAYGYKRSLMKTYSKGLRCRCSGTDMLLVVS
jgi:hypothetical protein